MSLLSIYLVLYYRASFSNTLLPIYIAGGIIIVAMMLILVIKKYPDYFKMIDE